MLKKHFHKTVQGHHRPCLPYLAAELVEQKYQTIQRPGRQGCEWRAMHTAYKVSRTVFPPQNFKTPQVTKISKPTSVLTPTRVSIPTGIHTLNIMFSDGTWRVVGSFYYFFTQHCRVNVVGTVNTKLTVSCDSFALPPYVSVCVRIRLTVVDILLWCWKSKANIQMLKEKKFFSTGGPELPSLRQERLKNPQYPEAQRIY